MNQTGNEHFTFLPRANTHYCYANRKLSSYEGKATRKKLSLRAGSPQSSTFFHSVLHTQVSREGIKVWKLYILDVFLFLHVPKLA